MVLLINLLLIAIFICGGMTVISWLIYRSLRTPLLKFIFYFWASHLMNLVVASIFAESQNSLVWIVVMLPWPFIYYFQSQILAEFEPTVHRFKHILPLYVGGYLLTLIVSFFTDDFTLITFPAVLSVGIAGFSMCWEFWKCIRHKEKRTLDKILLLLLISFSIHSLDYSFLRPYPEFAIFGFSYFLFNIVGYAVILPTMAMKQAGDLQRLHLENLVQEKTEQLLQQSKLSALGEMAAGVAHEINNPLAIIVGRSEQVLNRRVRNELEASYLIESMNVIQTTSFRISNIIKALMDFSKQGLQSPYNIETLEKTVTDIKVLCEERFRFHGVKLILEGDFSLQIKTRGPQISQVVLNLLNNAFDATEKEVNRWVKITVGRHHEVIRIAVSDSGKGVPLENRDKIMLPFFTSKEVGKGVGLGLSISKGIVESHGGHFYLDSLQSETTFVIELPVLT